MVVVFETDTDAAGAPPIVTVAPGAKLTPVIVMTAPPVVVAAVGEMLEMRGAVDDSEVDGAPHPAAAAVSTTIAASRSVRTIRRNSVAEARRPIVRLS